jgi:uncharacterized protein YbdZ (MbtH family)
MKHHHFESDREYHVVLRSAEKAYSLWIDENGEIPNDKTRSIFITAFQNSYAKWKDIQSDLSTNQRSES